MAVACPPFTSADHERARIVREVSDLFDLDRAPLTPRPEPTLDLAESIVMEGAEIRRTMRTGSHEVRQRYTAALADDAPLSIVDDTPPAPFEPDMTLARAAAVRLAAMQRKPKVAPPRRPAPSRGVPLWVVLVAAFGVAVACWQVAGLVLH